MPMNPTVVEIDPSAERDCYFDLENDTVSSAAWTSTALSPSGTPALTLGTPVNTSTRTRSRISGIAEDSLHRVQCIITATSGQKLVMSRYVRGVRQ